MPDTSTSMTATAWRQRRRASSAEAGSLAATSPAAPRMPAMPQMPQTPQAPASVHDRMVQVMAMSPEIATSLASNPTPTHAKALGEAIKALVGAVLASGEAAEPVSATEEA